MNSEVNVPVPAVYTRFVNQKAQHRYADIWTPAKSFVLPEACVSRKYTNVPIVAFYAVVPLLLLCTSTSTFICRNSGKSSALCRQFFRMDDLCTPRLTRSG